MVELTPCTQVFVADLDLNSSDLDPRFFSLRSGSYLDLKTCEQKKLFFCFKNVLKSFFFPVVFFLLALKAVPTVYCICTRDHNGNNGVNEGQK